MVIKWRYKKNRHQKIYHEDVLTRFLHLSGGYGCGKTYGLVMKGFQLSWLNRDIPGGLLVGSYTEYKRDVLPAINEILESHRLIQHCRYHGSDKTWTFPWSKAPLYVVTAENPLKGPNWGYGLINELSFIPFVRFREMMGRVRHKGSKFPQIASSGTYEGIHPEYDDFFWDKPNPASKVIQGSTRDNTENLEAGFIPMLESAYDSKQVAAYVDGERVNLLGNLFYYAYSGKNEVPGYKIPDNVHGFLVTLDFNVDPFCAGIWVRDAYGVVCVDQVKLEGGKGYDSRQMLIALHKRGYNGTNCALFPDPAGAARATQGKPDIDQFRHGIPEMGIPGFSEIHVKSSAPRLRQRQLNSNNLLEKRIVRVDPVKAPDMKKDLMKVTQDPVTLEKVKDNPTLTHFSDGMDYMLDILFPWSGVRSEVRIERLR